MREAPPIVEVPSSTPEPQQRTVRNAEPDEPAPRVMALARQTVELLARRDIEGLAKLVHPTRGVRFSPYAFVDKGDVVMKPEELVRAWRDPSQRVWGAFDGSGDPIRMGFPAYYQRFVYDVDFARAPHVAENRLIRTGNTVSNLAQEYPDAEFVEFHFTGFDPRFEGMDWKSLRLVFARDADRSWLVGIVHDEWTI